MCFGCENKGEVIKQTQKEAKERQLGISVLGKWNLFVAKKKAAAIEEVLKETAIMPIPVINIVNRYAFRS